MLVTGAGLKLQRAVIELLQREYAELLRRVLRQKGLIPDHVEIA